MSERRKVAAACGEPTCDRPAYAKGLCSRHYQRQYWAARRAAEVRRVPPRGISLDHGAQMLEEVVIRRDGKFVARLSYAEAMGVARLLVGDELINAGFAAGAGLLTRFFTSADDLDPDPASGDTP